MSNLEQYIKNVTEYFKKHPDYTETEKIMYVYLDLGKKFKRVRAAIAVLQGWLQSIQTIEEIQRLSSAVSS